MKIKYTITGLDCPNCAAKLAGQMSSIEGVDSAKINFLTEKLTVETTLAESEAYDALSKAAKAFSRDIVIEK
ncbi:MAG: cation transporter [Clostridia bacterium]|nr:cation transporter [Clostridia bacterium]MBR2850634.1 cation transporter [Clostridia bacterium]MBR3876496.1 cation transporter [Clostridia bacterium]